MKRIILLILVLLVVRPAFALPRLESVHVNLDYIAKHAEARAHKPFHSPRADLPEVLRKLTYDQYREIEFRHDKALWAEEKLPFRVEFFHPGYLYQEPVHFNEFTLTHAQPIRFVTDFFDYRALKMSSEVPANTGYAGFRLLYPLNQTNKLDEVGAFLGASYFRLLGQGQTYGQSARGLALDCGETNRPEEFPLFTDWWLGKPQRDDDLLRLYAILDSVSCVGAYEFLIRPGQTTVAEVEAVLYFRDATNIHAADAQRKPLATIGQAPLTSMFWFGKNSERKFDDYRPEVHDSDGLLMRLEDGSTEWRPLDNGVAMRHEIFPANNIRGFGLLQRERNFSDYQDMFNPYQTVPSVWVAPHGNWGEGSLHLVELSTQYEGLDNIVAFWDPAVKPQPFQPYHFGYTLYWTREADMTLSSNEVVSTRIGLNPRNTQQRQFVIDFDVPGLTSEDGPPKADTTCTTNGAIVENQIFRNRAAKTWRVILEMEPKAGNHDPVDLTCILDKGKEPLSEKWSYRWTQP
ncbi:MAG TPA: glucan biosynthesis protein G [Candidatus Saccharimonadales bacterium]|nr:glucan biosynthesis protein G [Candidatus Saccharimonadales bacterium]